jgi:hypothetical protein
MSAALAASIIDLVLGSTLGSTGEESGNRVSLEGLSCKPGDAGALTIAVEKLSLASLRIAAGPLTLELGQLSLQKLVAVLRIEDGKPRVSSLEAASGELSGVKAQGPLDLGQMPTSTAWSLAPLAAANGTIRAQIVDAALLFDADVTVPIVQGRIDFSDATVEHVGPDSRMGASRLGLYVDAPNGRSYLYQFSTNPVAGVEYEKRGVLPGPWGRDRGSLQLQPFTEWLLRQPPAAQALAFTEQARTLLDRTAISGEVRLSDGSFSAPGVHAELLGRAEGRNVVSLHSEAVGRGVTIAMPSLSVRNAVLDAGKMRFACGEVTGALTLKLFVEGKQLRFESLLSKMKFSGLKGPL